MIWTTSVITVGIFLAVLLAYRERQTNIAPHYEVSVLAEGWEEVGEAFRENIYSGLEPGGSFAVYHKGKLVVHVFGGYADPSADWRWHTNTLTQCYSTTKGIAAIVIAHLVQNGFLKYSDPISKVWPEFAQNGKEQITLEHFLSHQAGLSMIDESFSGWDLLDNTGHVGSILAKQTPMWPPGHRHGYHVVTFGLYLDQIVRRADPKQRNLAKYFTEEIAKPLGIESDTFIGLPLTDSYRCARCFLPNLLGYDTLFASKYWRLIWTAMTDGSSLISGVLKNPSDFLVGKENNPLWRTIPSAATHGFSTTPALAKIYGVISSKKHQDITTGFHLTKESAEMLQTPIVSGPDAVVFFNTTFGRGMTIMDSPNGGIMFGTPGVGGQMGYGDLSEQLGWAYLTNHRSLFEHGDDPRYLKLENALYRAVKKL